MYYYIIFIYFLVLCFFTMIFSFNLNNNAKKYVYITLSFFLLLITSGHPFAYSVDDQQYSLLAQNILDHNEYFFDGIDYDYLYFTILKLLLLIFPIWFSIIFISVVALYFKLYIIAKLTNFSILSLFIYFTIFYELHDLTQFRVSLAVSFFYIALYFIITYKSFIRSLFIFMFAGLSHFQAIPSFIVPLISKIFKYKFYLTFFLTIFVYFFSNINIFNILGYFGFSVELFRATFDSSNLVGISKFNLYNLLIFFILLLMIPILNNSVNNKNIYIYTIAFYSILFGFILSTMLSGIGEESRIIQFFFTTIVFLLPLVNSKKKMYFSITFIGVLFFIWFGQINKLFI